MVGPCLPTLGILPKVKTFAEGVKVVGNLLPLRSFAYFRTVLDDSLEKEGFLGAPGMPVGVAERADAVDLVLHPADGLSEEDCL